MARDTLPERRDAIGPAHGAIDTFVVRAGDALSAGLVWVGTLFAAGPRVFLAANVGLSALWAVTAWRLGRQRASRYEPSAAQATSSWDAIVSVSPTTPPP